MNAPFTIVFWFTIGLHVAIEKKSEIEHDRDRNSEKKSFFLYLEEE